MRIEHYSDVWKGDVTCLVEKFQLLFLEKHDDVMDRETIDKTIQGFSGENAKNSFLLIVDEKCVALMAGISYDSQINKKKIWAEIFWYMDEGSGWFAYWFIQQIENMLKGYGFNTIIMTVIDSPLADKVKKMYENVGYKLLETSYQKTL
jgi:hypothetical protein